MKKLLALIFSLLSVTMLRAQEKSIEIKIKGEPLSTELSWKVTLLVVFATIIIILVLRTFRGKPNV